MSVPRPNRLCALVTGGRGFIGSHLVDALLAGGVNVVSVDTKPSIDMNHPQLRNVVGDIRDEGVMNELFERYEFDQVYDLASFTEVGLPFSAYRRNVDQTEAMIRYCKRHSIQKYIFYSTQFVHRRPDTPPKSEQDYAPTEAYGRSKVLSEERVREGLSEGTWLILRPTYIWGPGLTRFRDGLLYRLAKKQFLISNDASVMRYYGYVETIVAQTIALAALDYSKLDTKVFYISDSAISLSDFCAHLVDAMGKGRAYRAPARVIRALGVVGSFFEKIGLPPTINAVQARELTTNFPVPVEPTLQLTGKSTDYICAANRTVAWALQDPKFRESV